MNNPVNIASSAPPTTSDAALSSATKTGEESHKRLETGDTSGSAGSFHESIKKAYDQSKNDTEIKTELNTETEVENTGISDEEAGGNNLPLSGDFSEPSAQDDRALLPAGLYLSGQSPVTNKQPAAAEETQPPSPVLKTDVENIIDDEIILSSTALSTDKKPAADIQSAEIASQARQLLNPEKNTDTKTSQPAGNINSTSDSAETDGNKVENAVIKQNEVLTLKTEIAGLTGDKFQPLLNTANQQLLSASSQTSLLLQTASAQSDPANDVLPLLTNPLSNNPSTINLQPAIPQAGITEVFGRPAWSQGMGKQILMMVNQNITTAEIRLNPAHLGPIEVLIDMSEEQVSVSMSSRHALVRDAMEQALPKLREMLEQNGFSLADADISKHSFAEQREQNSESSRKNITASNIDPAVATEVGEQIMRQTAMSSSMVDYYI